jgi:membrane-associated phospholipid phosphatase
MAAPRHQKRSKCSSVHCREPLLHPKEHAAKRYVLPGKLDFVLPFSFLLVFALMYMIDFLPQHQQMVTNQASYTQSPIFFGQRSNATFCFAADIKACRTFNSPNHCCAQLNAEISPSTQLPALHLILIAVLLPILVLLVSSTVWNPADGEWHCVWLGFCMAFNVNLLLTESFKRLIGYPRPNYQALVALIAYNPVAYAHFKKELFTNMPSGHASLTMVSMVYLALYFSTKLKSAHAYHADSRAASRGAGHGQVYLAEGNSPLLQFGMVVCFSPVLLALWVGTTRLQDHFHSNEAVVLGWVFGAASAFFGWHVSALPYIGPIWRSDHANAK